MAGTLRLGEVECIAPAGDRCGEGAVWHSAEQAVYWTDINRFLIHRYELANGAVQSWFFDEPVTALTLTDREEVLAAVLASRLVFWEPRTNRRWDHGFRLPGWPRVRCNDARVDPRGSLWIGTMRNNVHPDGSPGQADGSDGILYRIDPGGEVSEWAREIGIANTMAWSPDRSGFYFADTLRNRIAGYRYDAATGSIQDEKSFFEGFERGLPDGSAMDSESYLWNCRYGGGCVVRIAPSGEVDRVLEIPAENPTTCIFGGPGHSTLFVTSAGLDASPSDRLGGSLFMVETGVAGLEANRFRCFGS